MTSELGDSIIRVPKSYVTKTCLHFRLVLNKEAWLCIQKAQINIYINMVQCFVPDCNHQSERETCSFFRFPKEEKEKKRWITLIRYLFLFINMSDNTGFM